MCQLELIDNSALKLYLKNKTADIVLARIERSELINRDKEVSQILIHWGVDEVTDLNELIRLKKSAPSPIVRDYEWCGLYNPFEHQRITSEFLSINSDVLFLSGFVKLLSFSTNSMLLHEKIKKSRVQAIYFIIILLPN